MFCLKQFGELQGIHDELLNLGYQMVALSPDKPSALREWMGEMEADISFTILSDSTAAAARAYGVSFSPEAPGARDFLYKWSGEYHTQLPVPSVFIFGRSGVVDFTYVDPDYRRRIPGKVLLAAAQAIADRDKE